MEGLHNFSQLDELIHSGAKEIELTSDVVLGDGEEMEYFDGIKLDVSDLVINGNGHAIDACGKTRIFICSARNVTLKNLTLKNGYVFNEEESLKDMFLGIFKSRKKEKRDGVVLNLGGLTLSDCMVAANRGGAIYNSGTLTVTDSTFNNNVTEKVNGGAISNWGALTVRKSTFKQNNANGSAGGAIYNQGGLSISDSTFNENGKELCFSGGAVCSSAGSRLEVSNSSFEYNGSPNCNGGAIFMTSISDYHSSVNDCRFIGNRSFSVGCHDGIFEY